MACVRECCSTLLDGRIARVWSRDELEQLRSSGPLAVEEALATTLSQIEGVFSPS